MLTVLESLGMLNAGSVGPFCIVEVFHAIDVGKEIILIAEEDARAGYNWDYDRWEQSLHHREEGDFLLNDATCVHQLTLCRTHQEISPARSRRRLPLSMRLRSGNMTLLVQFALILSLLLTTCWFSHDFEKTGALARELVQLEGQTQQSNYEWCLQCKPSPCIIEHVRERCRRVTVCSCHAKHSLVSMAWAQNEPKRCMMRSVTAHRRGLPVCMGL